MFYREGSRARWGGACDGEPVTGVDLELALFWERESYQRYQRSGSPIGAVSSFTFSAPGTFTRPPRSTPHGMSYLVPTVRGLAACPFCREIFPEREETACPLCSVALVPLSSLPPREEDEHDDEADGGVAHDKARLAPEEKPLPWTYLGLARGPLLALAALGLISFFLPWVHTFTPDRRVFTGADIAQRTGIAWGAFAAWFTMVPLVLSRRTPRAMQGARLIVALLGAVPATVAATLLLNPPTSAQARGLTIALRFEWDGAIYATVALGVLAAALGALRFGGSSD